MKITSKYLFVSIIAANLLLSSCKEKEFAVLAPEKGSYFSIKKYALDEWTTHAGEPVSFTKTVKLNGVTDSGVTNIEHIDWPAVLQVFTDGDISDHKYLGRYTFTQLDDSFNRSHDFIYTANESDLFTQKLLISMDMYTMEVKGVYMETFKSNFWNKRQQKLMYSPVKTIMIQQYDKPLIGAKKELIIKYKAI